MKQLNLITVAALLTLAGVTIADSDSVDKRQTIHLDDEERHIVLTEMRTFLSTIQQITQGIANEDLNKVSSAAKAMGNDASGGVSLSLIFKLPFDFKLLAADTHQKFDQIALDANSLADRDHALEQVAVLMQNCVACHALYRIELEDD